MTGSEHDHDLIRHVRSALDASAENLDAETRAELQRIRRDALSQIPPRHSQRPGWLIPASAFTTLACASLVVSLWVNQPARRSLPELEDLELLSSSETLEFFENLDFYQWLPEDDRAS